MERGDPGLVGLELTLPAEAPKERAAPTVTFDPDDEAVMAAARAFGLPRYRRRTGHAGSVDPV